MNYSILKIATPENCSECKLSHELLPNYNVCLVRMKECKNEVPGWCPLIPEGKDGKIYEDDNWTIDKVNGKIRISYFEDYHFKDDIILTKKIFEVNENE